MDEEVLFFFVTTCIVFSSQGKRYTKYSLWIVSYCGELNLRVGIGIFRVNFSFNFLRIDLLLLLKFKEVF